MIRPAGNSRTCSTRPGRSSPTSDSVGDRTSASGMHVARAEMYTAINAVLERLPGLRLDTGVEHPRASSGMYERGPTAVPVLF